MRTLGAQDPQHRPPIVVLRYGELQSTRIRGAAAELASMRLDAIVTSCTGTTRAAVSAAGSTPVVFASLGDPVLAGLVPSLGRPGGNVTGRMSLALETIPKKLELLQKALPESARAGARIAVLMNGTEPAHEASWRAAEETAKALKLALVRIEMNGPSKVDASLEALARSDAQALLVFSDDPVVIENLGRIAAAANKLRTPSISGPRVFAAAGGLMSYGMDMKEDYRLSAKYVVSVANGAAPGSLAIEQPLEPRLTINAATAAALGLRLPNEILFFANEVIP